jgi:hypothetical protein
VLYVEAPSGYDPGTLPAVFLAGGITGCPDWQAEVVRMLADAPLALLNPRREDFPIHDPAAAPAQIEWEYRHLGKADAALFWFPCETLCPIALDELGAWSARRDGGGHRPAVHRRPPAVPAPAGRGGADAPGPPRRGRRRVAGGAGWLRPPLGARLAVRPAARLRRREFPLTPRGPPHPDSAVAGAHAAQELPGAQVNINMARRMGEAVAGLHVPDVLKGPGGL